MIYSKQISFSNSYYVGKDTLVGEFPALRLYTDEYTDENDAKAALKDLKDRFPNAKIYEWQDLHDIDNPLEIINSVTEAQAVINDKRREEAKHALAEGVAEAPESIDKKPDMPDGKSITAESTGVVDGKHSQDRQPDDTAQGNTEMQLPKEVVVGAWFEIYMGEGKPKRYLKLVEISYVSRRLVFSNQRNEIRVEIDMDRLIQDFQRGFTNIFSEGGSFHQTLSSVIGSIRTNNRR